MRRLVLAAAVAAALPSLAVAPHAFAQAEGRKVNLAAPNGDARGTVTITAAPRGVLLRIEAKGLTPGWHGVHFHEKADCGDPKFQNAGSHIHAAKPVTHGLLSPDANDSGDLPNIFAGADGSATAEIYTSLVTVAATAGSSQPTLLDADGAAVIIHANADDHRTQPIGGAGDRVACGAITAK